MAGEVGELVAEFQWLTPQEAVSVMTDDAEAGVRIRAELGDVTNYLVRLADVLDVDLVAAAQAKIDANEARYPADTYRPDESGQRISVGPSAWIYLHVEDTAS